MTCFHMLLTVGYVHKLYFVKWCDYFLFVKQFTRANLVICINMHNLFHLLSIVTITNNHEKSYFVPADLTSGFNILSCTEISVEILSSR